MKTRRKIARLSVAEKENNKNVPNENKILRTLEDIRLIEIISLNCKIM